MAAPTRAAGSASTARSAEHSPSARATRERILEATCYLIAEEGLDAVRIARVAMLAGASTALVHHYFSTREELVEQALMHSFEVLGVERFAEEAEGGAPPVEGLARVIRECLPIPGPQERDWVLWVELWLRTARDPDLRPVATRLYARYHEWVADAIRAGIESGDFRSVDPDLVADHAMAVLDGFGVRALIGDPAMELERAHRLIADLLARELGLDADRLLHGG
jgi:AcrR family transcriptional regulator